MKNEDIKFATELIAESKRNSKRWFIIAVIELFIILAITGMFVWYLYLPEEEVTETTTEMNLSERTVERDIKQIKHKIYKIL